MAAAARGQRVAVIISRDIAPYQEAAGGFKKSLGAPVAEYNLEGDVSQGPEIISRIRNGTSTLVVAIGSEALQVALTQRERPVLFTMVLTPKQGLENAGGVVLEVTSTAQLEALQEAIPELKSLGLIYHATTGRRFQAEAKAACQELGLTLRAVGIESDREVAAAARSLVGTVDALWMVPDLTNISAQGAEAILLFGLENRVPILAPSEKFVKAGALIAVSANYAGMGAQTARLAESVLRGDPIGNLPLERPRKLSISLNLKVAAQMGLTIPPSIVRKADHVFQ